MAYVANSSKWKRNFNFRTSIEPAAAARREAVNVRAGLIRLLIALRFYEAERLKKGQREADPVCGW